MYIILVCIITGSAINIPLAPPPAGPEDMPKTDLLHKTRSCI